MMTFRCPSRLVLSSIDLDSAHPPEDPLGYLRALVCFILLRTSRAFVGDTQFSEKRETRDGTFPIGPEPPGTQPENVGELAHCEEEVKEIA